MHRILLAILLSLLFVAMFQMALNGEWYNLAAIIIGIGSVKNKLAKLFKDEEDG